MSKLAIRQWPLLRQLAAGTRGEGADAMSDATHRLQPRHAAADVARSICPYCGVGCGQLVFHRGNELVSIEGDPASPISAGHLCPKGAASHELLTHPNRLTRVKYRAPYATAWQEIDLERAMDMIAERVWTSRERGFVEDTRRQAADAAAHDRASRRRDARQRRKLPAEKAVCRRARDGRRQQSGADMT